MQFYVSARGQVIADTLCRFDKVQIPANAFVEERATVSDYYCTFDLISMTLATLWTVLSQLISISIFL